MRERVDVAIVGGGIAGGALGLALARHGLSTVILERQAQYREFDRGEFLAPWGVQEAERMGVADAIYSGDAWPVHRWIQYDEINDPDSPPMGSLADWTEDLGLKVEGPMTIRHYSVCEELTHRARAAGAEVVMGADSVRVSPGPEPSVTFGPSGRQRTIQARLVVAAGGRRAPTARQLGFDVTSRHHHWGSGLNVEVPGWPEDGQTMGTEGDLMFFVFPQGPGRVQLYLAYASDQSHRFAGRDGAQRFLEAFDFRCMPWSKEVRDATPRGPCFSYPCSATTVEPVLQDGLVLLGDEAGSTDTSLGTGVANSLRDARMVAELLIGSDRWDVGTLSPYRTERAARLATYNACADLMATLFAEFGPDARERRRRALELINDDSSYHVLVLAICGGPERLPDERVTAFLAKRLLAIAGAGTRTTTTDRCLAGLSR